MTPKSSDDGGNPGYLYRMSDGEVSKSEVDMPSFDEVKKKMLDGVKPYQK